ncbi:hypothetical protein Vretimale_18891 [Volvox reticuliferus]|uniref:C-CAP/cofactor C-like domain-containing protein n=1 Tax=Volvox reticuliferus TaxID=1737510 RepID=A0A8J4FTC7_9CHLO|nr:hypothetical protein Vretifemale_17280 [Volvox reticuliferus]GIM16294.1 hypothetical protein Vretimale_18891 [Volvox reticuliferus]
MATGLGSDVPDEQTGIEPLPGDDHLENPSTLPNTQVAAAVVLEKLAELDVARKAERERRREESRAAADPRESVKRFLRNFAAQQRNINDALQRMLASHQGQQQQQQQQQPPPTNSEPGQEQQQATDPDDTDAPHIAPLPVSTTSPEEIQAGLELVGAEVVSLEQAAAAASYYLPAYDQKQCAATIASMRAAIEAARTALAPRRRFAFGNKKVSKVRGAEVSAAAAATVTIAAGAGAATAPTASALELTSGSASPKTSVMPISVRLTAASPLSGSADAGSATASATAAGDDADARPTAAVSDQDRALVARGRGLLGLSDTTIVLPGDEVSERGTGGDFVLLNLTRCRVVLLGRLRALRIAGLRNCTVVSGPVTGACFVDDVRGSSLSLATYQVRVHRTYATDLFLRVRSKPIIEHSTGIRVAPWAAAVAPDAKLERLLQAHMLGEETGCWQQVDDFGWIKSVQSPNWCVLPPEEYPGELMAVPASVWECGEGAGIGAGDSGRGTEGVAAPEEEVNVGEI